MDARRWVLFFGGLMCLFGGRSTSSTLQLAGFGRFLWLDKTSSATQFPLPVLTRGTRYLRNTK